jgi:hypothetical protein
LQHQQRTATILQYLFDIITKLKVLTMKSAILISLLSAANVVAFAPATIRSKTQQLSSSNSKEGLETIATKLNPLVGFYDPLGLADQSFWNQGQEATIGFLRHAEIKHSRVAMAAFVGYCVQSTYTFPWAQTMAGGMHPSADLSPEAQWDATPLGAKYQILFFIGLLEIWDELGGSLSVGEGNHYMKGRQPGKYPPFDNFSDSVHPVLNLYDPFRISKNMPEKKREKRLLAEINNGRLAMFGIFGLLAADVVPGSVPILAGTARPYDGNIMVPFSADFSLDTNTIVGTITFVFACAALNAGKQSADAQDAEELTLAPSAVVAGSDGGVDVSIPYDAAANLAFESSDKSVEYEAFKTEFEADAAKDAGAKWAEKFAKK